LFRLAARCRKSSSSSALLVARGPGPHESGGHEDGGDRAIALLAQYGDSHILHNGQALEETEVLKCPRYAEPHRLGRVDVRYVLTEEDDPARVGPIEPRDEVEDRGLARPVWSDNAPPIRAPPRKRRGRRPPGPRRNSCSDRLPPGLSSCPIDPKNFDSFCARRPKGRHIMRIMRNTGMMTHRYSRMPEGRTIRSPSMIATQMRPAENGTRDAPPCRPRSR